MNEVDLSPLGLFMQASPVVKGVFCVLIGYSLLCWSVILEKVFVLRRLRAQAARLERAPAAAAGEGLAAALYALGRREAECLSPNEDPDAVRERIERTLQDHLAAVLLRAEQRLGYLATISSTAPFVGLFGTVWGVMNAFAGIARLQNASLAAVAPGIAEALAATAIGLLAAIPAAIAYNEFAGELGHCARRIRLGIARLAVHFSMEAPPCPC